MGNNKQNFVVIQKQLHSLIEKYRKAIKKETILKELSNSTLEKFGFEGQEKLKEIYYKSRQAGNSPEKALSVSKSIIERAYSERGRTLKAIEKTLLKIKKTL